MKNSKTKEDVVIATSEGRLYIKTKDFFKQDKIKETIDRLINSNVVKEIDKNNKKPVSA